MDNYAVGGVLMWAGVVIILLAITRTISRVVKYQSASEAFDEWGLGAFALGYGVASIGCFIMKTYVPATAFACIALVDLYGLFRRWWRNKKRRSLKALGAKSRALISKMVSELKVRARPRPILNGA